MLTVDAPERRVRIVFHHHLRQRGGRPALEPGEERQQQVNAGGPAGRGG